MKRTLIALAALGISTGAFAVPALNNNSQGFFINVTGAYLQPSASGSDLAYGYSQTPLPIFPAVINGANNRLQEVDPTYNAAWGVALGWMFPNQVDVDASYFHLSSSATSTTGINTTTGVPAQPFTIENPNTQYTVTNSSSVTAKAQYDLNRFDLFAGKTFDATSNLLFHPTIGLAFVQLERQLTTNATLFGIATGDFASGNTSDHVLEKSNFRGLGPDLGLDATYNVIGGFDLVAHADTALLAGTIDTNDSLLSQGNGVSGIGTVTPAPGSSSAWSQASTHRIVPAATMDLGAAYTFVLDTQQRSHLRVEAGWKWSDYVNSIDRTFASGVDNTNGTIYANPNGGTTTSSFAFQGPYVNLALDLY